MGSIILGIISSMGGVRAGPNLSWVMFNKHFPSATGLAALTLVTAVPLCASLSACSTLTDWTPWFLTPYRPDVQQGNIITKDMVDQLRPGMTRDQVRFMLGTPLLTDMFHQDRWDYTYYLKRRGGETQIRKLVIYFGDNRLTRFESDEMPPESLADNLILGRKPKQAPKPPPKEEQPQITLPASK